MVLVAEAYVNRLRAMASHQSLTLMTSILLYILDLFSWITFFSVVISTKMLIIQERERRTFRIRTQTDYDFLTMHMGSAEIKERMTKIICFPTTINRRIRAVQTKQNAIYHPMPIFNWQDKKKIWIDHQFWAQADWTRKLLPTIIRSRLHPTEPIIFFILCTNILIIIIFHNNLNIAYVMICVPSHRSPVRLSFKWPRWERGTCMKHRWSRTNDTHLHHRK